MSCARRAARRQRELQANDRRDADTLNVVAAIAPWKIDRVVVKRRTRVIVALYNVGTLYTFLSIITVVIILVNRIIITVIFSKMLRSKALPIFFSYYFTNRFFFTAFGIHKCT